LEQSDDDVHTASAAKHSRNMAEEDAKAIAFFFY